MSKEKNLKKNKTFMKLPYFFFLSANREETLFIKNNSFKRTHYPSLCEKYQSSNFCLKCIWTRGLSGLGPRHIPGPAE